MNIPIENPRGGIIDFYTINWVKITGIPVPDSRFHSGLLTVNWKFDQRVVPIQLHLHQDLLLGNFTPDFADGNEPEHWMDDLWLVRAEERMPQHTSYNHDVYVAQIMRWDWNFRKWTDTARAVLQKQHAAYYNWLTTRW